jgi:predicted nucleic acid-binding protein
MYGFVKANVVDIRVDRPRPKDDFIVDTNVWFWLNYGKSSISSTPYQVREYPRYIRDALKAKARLFHSALSLPELAHIIEDSELAIWVAKTRRPNDRKYFRYEAGERTAVTEEIDSAWASTIAMSELVECNLDRTTTDATLECLRKYPLDGYDAILLTTLKAHGMGQVITDDRDYLAVEDIVVFTANDQAVVSADRHGKLIRR